MKLTSVLREKTGRIAGTKTFLPEELNLTHN